MTVNELVCKNVKILCKINHISLGEVEKNLGKKPGFFSKRCKVNPDMMIGLAAFFEMTTDDLMKIDFEKHMKDSEEKENLIKAVKVLTCKMSKDEMMKWLIHVINCAYCEGE